ncbi:sidestep protein, putative [Ixodes scapularis]|uniref:Sidestep protein, putative n=1 Tax=Ixodes scapularis TaxID=6945 RepID=B7QLJ5_IXOSC|nr:sidestep protein, putative [Ixodes scapularis]|eukprot:XP_002416050.1 sidestep protein, putative [Ixodes scapularis]
MKYKPKVELTLGSHPRQWNIVEGHDLYLECSVDANPRIGDVLWRLDGRDLHPGRHVIMSNQSLALQSVRRDSSGSYTCVATNRVGETQSEPLNIVVKHSPACNQSQTTVYAASRHEEVHVICDVASEPKDVKFRWTFNNSATKHDVTSFTSSGTRSVLYYTARKDSDYGTFQCLANNSVGEMKTPCYFQIVPAGPLNTMYHCAVTNITDVGLQVDCQRKDGTTVGAQEGAMLPDDVAAEASTFRQRHGFQLEVRDLLLDRVLFNSTSEMASFTISQLVLLVCVVLVTSTEGGFYGEGERHVYAGAEDYPPGFVISTLRSEEDKHGHEQRGYGHGHRDYVNEPEYVVRSPYGALLQQAESHSQFYGGGVGPIGHDHVGFYGTGVREDYLMAR